MVLVLLYLIVSALFGCVVCLLFVSLVFCFVFYCCLFWWLCLLDCCWYWCMVFNSRFLRVWDLRLLLLICLIDDFFMFGWMFDWTWFPWWLVGFVITIAVAWIFDFSCLPLDFAVFAVALGILCLLVIWLFVFAGGLLWFGVLLLICRLYYYWVLTGVCWMTVDLLLVLVVTLCFCVLFVGCLSWIFSC